MRGSSSGSKPPLSQPLPDDRLRAGLAALSQGEPGALARVLPLVYARLRAIAREQLQNERAGHTLQPTALVHEAFLKIGWDDGAAPPRDEAHFFAIAARAMRQVLIDHARTRGRQKRGGPGGGARVSIELADPSTPGPSREINLIDLDDALQRLSGHDELAARIVEMRFFAGMEVEAIAEVLGIADRTVRRHWVYAKAWLAREMGRDVDSNASRGGEPV